MIHRCNELKNFFFTVRFSKRSRGIPLVYRQSVQLLYKKFVYTWRNWFGVLLFVSNRMLLVEFIWSIAIICVYK